MTRIKINPWRGFEKVAQRMQDVMSDMEKGLYIEYGNSFTPRVDILEDSNSIYVQIEIAGLSKDDVKISVNEDRIMNITGTKKPKEEGDKKFISLRTERIFGTFTRTFFLPENIDLEKVDAKFENGVLEIKLNKIEPPKPKEVEISIS